MAWRAEPEEADGGERAARRTVWLLAFSVAVVVVGSVTAVAVTQVLERRTSEAAAQAAAVAVDDGPGPSGIGPRAGADVAAYGRDRSAALAAADGERLAVASLAAYVSEDEARATASRAGVEVGALLAAVPGEASEVVTADLTTWLAPHRTRLEDERRELQRLLPTVSDPVFQAEYEAEIAALTRRLDGLRPGAALVFGLVVQGPAAALRDLAADPAVRLVDVASSAEPPTGYRGLRPEESLRVADPPVRPRDG